MRIWRRLLEREGLTVTSRWLDMASTPPASLEAQAAIAAACLEDVQRADAVIAFTDAPTSYWTGGRHVEVGAALAWDKPIYVVGPVENVFHALPHPRVVRCRDVADVLAHLGREESSR